MVALVSRHDDTHIEAIGTLAIDNPAPMQRDTIFRIASLSKIVTAVAGMTLVEDCKLRLDDSVERWLPELANRRVLKSISAKLDETVPARRAITVRDLFTYRMGFGSVMAMPDTYPKYTATIESAATAPCCRRLPPGWTSGCRNSVRCRCCRNRESGGCSRSALFCASASSSRSV
jgi:CubicO group peptidase (beta-lactamase class C family)